MGLLFFMTKDKIGVMGYSNQIFIVLIFFVSCNNGKNRDDGSDISALHYSGVDSTWMTDTLLMPFTDTALKLRISSQHSIGEQYYIYKTSIVLSENNRVIYSDSVYSTSFDFELKDLDNDGHKDLMLFHSSGGRANPTYYLYLIKSNERVISKVDGFELLPNPELDGDIITSTALAGGSYVYKFYHILENKIVMLDSFVTSTGDSVIYEKRIRLYRTSKLR